MLPETMLAVRECSGKSGAALVILFGSRARNESHESSDWDFGYLAEQAWDPEGLRSKLMLATRCDRVDLVELSGANGLLRYRAARDAVLVYEKSSGLFETFVEQAIGFWLEAKPVLDASYRSALEELRK